MTTEQTTCKNCQTTQTVQSKPLSFCVTCQALIEKQYTCIVCESDGTGTHWIQTVTSTDLESAKRKAKQECATDWYGNDSETSSIHVLGVFPGDVSVLYYSEPLAQE